MKKKIIIGAVILAALTFAFFWNPSKKEAEKVQQPKTVETKQITEKKQQTLPETKPVINETPKADPPVAEKPVAEKPKEPAVQTAPEVSTEPETKPQTETTVPADELNCTLSVRCDTILNNKDKLDPNKAELVPPDGVIFKEQTVVFNEGETVYNLLLREMKKNKIHFEFSNTPAYNSAYIEGISNIYEFDCGELSGWEYKVNGQFPGCGCSQYVLHKGDKVEIVYTCDLGADVGGNNRISEEQK